MTTNSLGFITLVIIYLFGAIGTVLEQLTEIRVHFWQNFFFSD